MVKSLLITSALLASASAFAPAKTARTASSLNEFANGYVGGEGPEPMLIGGDSKNWDPVGFTEVSSHQFNSWMIALSAMVECLGFISRLFTPLGVEPQTSHSLAFLSFFTNIASPRMDALVP